MAEQVNTQHSAYLTITTGVGIVGEVFYDLLQKTLEDADTITKLTALVPGAQLWVVKNIEGTIEIGIGFGNGNINQVGSAIMGILAETIIGGSAGALANGVVDGFTGNIELGEAVGLVTGIVAGKATSYFDTGENMWNSMVSSVGKNAILNLGLTQIEFSLTSAPAILTSGGTVTATPITPQVTQTLPVNSEANLIPSNNQVGGSGTITTTAPDDSTITTAYSGDVATVTSSAGVQESFVYGSNGTTLQSDTWSNAANTTGTDTYNADGSSSGRITYANGSYAVYTDDGQGNISTDYYTAAGIETRATWVHADGTSGEISLYGDGVTQIPGGGSLDIPMSRYMVTQNPDGSYVTYAQDAQDGYINASYSSTGAIASSSTGTGSGVNDQAVASSQNEFVQQSSYYVDVNGTSVSNYAGMQYTFNYNASGALVGDTWYSAIVGIDATVANPNGAQIAWANNIMATGGTDIQNASGVLVRTATAVDGTVWQDTTVLAGDTVSHYSSNEVLLTDQWNDYDGMIATPALGPQAPVIGTPTVTGSDTFNGNAGSGTFTDTRDGTSGTVSLDGQGDISISNYNAGGSLTSTDSWNGSSYTIAMYGSTGAELSSYDYLANGDVTITDYAVDGSVADTQTEAAGLVVNPDGSDFSKIANAANQPEWALAA